MRHYETGVIIAPNLSDEEIEQQIKQMAEVISSLKGNLLREERWGKRKLAYPIKKFMDGYYLFLHYESGADVPAELERRFRQSEQILRFLTVKKEVSPFRRRKKKEEKAGEAELTAEVETEQNKEIKEPAEAESKEAGRERVREKEREKS